MVSESSNCALTHDDATQQNADEFKSVRLYDANVYDDYTFSRFMVQLFALDERGASFSIIVNDYEPFFYVKVPQKWSMSETLTFVKYLREHSNIKGDELVEGRIENHQKLYGYDNKTRHRYVRLTFRTQRAFQKVKRMWYETSGKEQVLKKDGLCYNKNTYLELYEAHIPPLLRFYHLQEISPSGWVQFPKELMHPGGVKTSCNYEVCVNCTQLVPLNDKETRVPYKICSFDIEADSSHGDFPMAIKTFRKLASEIVQYSAQNESCITSDVLVQSAQHAFVHALDEATIDSKYRHISPLYLQRPFRRINKEQDLYKIESAIRPKCIEPISGILKSAISVEQKKQRNISEYFSSKEKRKRSLQKKDDNPNKDDADADVDVDADADVDADEPIHGQDEENEENEDDGDDAIDDYEAKHKKDKMKNNETSVILEVQRLVKKSSDIKEMDLIQYLNSDAYTREEKTLTLDMMFISAFPCGVEGDKVTFIGSVFFKYGESEPYLNHCVSLDTCDDVPGVEIVSCNTEADVLMSWKNVINRENPDVIIGYNIFGFDYEFLFNRSNQLHMVHEFLTTFSKNQNEKCYTQNRDDTYKIAESKTKIASGEHHLHYIQMTGRVQIDLLNYLRRDYNLSSYKLDYVAGYFLGDAVRSFSLALSPSSSETTKRKPKDAQTRTLVQSKNLTGLYNDAYVTFEVSTHSSEMYNDGEKFMVSNLDAAAGTFWVEGVDLTCLNGKKVKWCLAKDDVTPQDIFRLTREGAAARSTVAKYCVQDCRLPMHLFNKIDILTGVIEMAKLCSVPQSFIVMRGQGIKLTSYVAKKCREMDTLIPTIAKCSNNEAYEGAIVLEPKCDLYLDTPIACVDYGSLYPSSMISDNISHDTKVWTKVFNEQGEQIAHIQPSKQLPPKGVECVDIEYDSYMWIPNKRGKSEKKCVGKKICRYVQPSTCIVDGPSTSTATSGTKKTTGVGIIPAILKELLAARKATRKQIPLQSDDFMKNVLDKRQLSIKVTANSIYGQCGAKTSTFYDMDVAASTTAIGRKLLMFAKDTIESKYGNGDDSRIEGSEKKGPVFKSSKYGEVRTNAHCVYGDSVTGETPIYIRRVEVRDSPIGQKNITSITSGYDGRDLLEICTIDSIAERFGELKWQKMTDCEKEYCELDGVECWSDTGWTPCYRVIRHILPKHKNIIRVLTHTGLVDVTDDHSLLRADGTEVSPKDVQVGDSLLHNPVILSEQEQCDNLNNIWIQNVHITKEKAMIMGFFFGDGSCGTYNCLSGIKRTWALNNANMTLISKYEKLCRIAYPEYEWIVYDTLKSSGVYKLTFKASNKIEFINTYRKMMYYDESKIIPKCILNGSNEIRRAFWEGLYDADGDKDNHGYTRIDQKSQISASHIYYLATSLGYNASINCRNDKQDVYRITMTTKNQRKCPKSIKKLYTKNIEQSESVGSSIYVYDLTTGNNHFAAGIGSMIVHNTDSAFVSFGLTEMDGRTKIVGKKALEISIEAGQEAGAYVTRQLKPPHDLEYEKTFLPFCLLSKKRYVGMLYETDPNKCSRKSMGIVLKRRDNAPIVKDTYGGIIDILMNSKDIEEATRYLSSSIRMLVEGKCPIQKLIITKSLRSEYKNPKQIAHKVLADRIAERDPGNAPHAGDRIAYVHVHVDERRGGKRAKLLTGEKIELPSEVISKRIPIDYTYYITNQIMKPLQQVFALVLERLPGYKNCKMEYEKREEELWGECVDEETFNKKNADFRGKLVKRLLFDEHLTRIENIRSGRQEITQFFRPIRPTK
mgnify:CR=1 FL=1